VDPADLRIVPLAPEHWEAVVDLFGRRGGDGGCWCMFWRYSSTEWSRSTNDANRGALHARAAEVPAPGLVAFRGDQAVGWVGLGPRTGFERLNRSRTLPSIDDRPVWAIVCFLVRRQARGAGLSGLLLQAAVDYARAHGAAGVEGYPVEPPPAPLPAALAYVGTTTTFERAGFHRVRPSTAHSGGSTRWIMRLEFEGPSG